MKTGNTGGKTIGELWKLKASMEPGHEDREYLIKLAGFFEAMVASMEPGHEDREYMVTPCWLFRTTTGLNGARS